MNRIELNFRSACALGIISCLVLFLAASAPHRVHHLFENLPAVKATPSSTLELEEPRRILVQSAGEDRSLDGHNHHQPLTHRNHEHARNGGLHTRGHHHHEHADHSEHHNNHHHHHAEPRSQATGNGAPLAPDSPLHAKVPQNDAHHDNSAQTVCLLQAAAQQSHLTSIDLQEIPFPGTGIAGCQARAVVAFSAYRPAPFSQRAPPAIWRGFSEIL